MQRENTAVFLVRKRSRCAPAGCVQSEEMRLAEGIQAESAAAACERGGVEVEWAATEKLGMGGPGEGGRRLRHPEEGPGAGPRVAKEHAGRGPGTREGHGPARVQEAEAGAIQRRGEAEAVAIQEKLRRGRGSGARASEKATAMKALDGVGREHEEFRLRLQQGADVELEAINVRKDIAQSQAKVLGRGLQQREVPDRRRRREVLRAVHQGRDLGSSVDGALDHGEALKTVLGATSTARRTCRRT